MKNYLNNLKQAPVVFLLIIFLSPSLVYSWTPNGESSTITSMIQWQDNQDVVFVLDSGVRCYVPSDESNLVSLVLSLYVSQKKATWHCHDEEETKGGFAAHRLHRVVSN